APKGAAREGSAPELALDLGGQAGKGAAWNGGEKSLFVPGAVAPPPGDAVRVVIRIPGALRPFTTEGRVADVRGSAEAVPGRPAGFSLRLADATADLSVGLTRFFAASEPETRRAAPR